MEIEEITHFIESLGGVHTLAPTPGTPFPEIAWGDLYFYYAPNAQTPTRTQPFATIITKNYPDDTTSDLNHPEAFRLNISAGRQAFLTTLGYPPRETSSHPTNAAQRDTLIAHPVYASAGWLAVVNPSIATEHIVEELLTTAHERARASYLRNAD